MKLKTKPSPCCTGCYYATYKDGYGGSDECAAQHGCRPKNGDKVIFVPDLVADRAEAWADKIEAWGKVPSARALLIEGLCNFGNDLLAWNHPVLLPKQFVPVLVKLRAADSGEECYAVLQVGEGWKWSLPDGGVLEEQENVLGWRYIID